METRDGLMAIHGTGAYRINKLTGEEKMMPLNSRKKKNKPCKQAKRMFHSLRSLFGL